MRLALKIFLANLLVILVLVGVAVWTLAEVARLINADRQVAVRSADALRVAASLRERVAESHRLELRALVFADREYVKLPQHEALRTQQGLDLLGTFLATDAEREAWREANEAFVRVPGRGREEPGGPRAWPDRPGQPAPGIRGRPGGGAA